MFDPVTQYWWKAAADADVGEKSMQYANRRAGAN
jgi:hypothetical protein